MSNKIFIEFILNIEVQSKISLRRCDGYCFEVSKQLRAKTRAYLQETSTISLSSRSTPAAPQSNSFCLEFEHFKETATGNVHLGQNFYQIVIKEMV